MASTLLLPGTATGPTIHLDDFDRFVGIGVAVRGDVGDTTAHKDKWVLVDNMQGARGRRLLMTGFENTAPTLTFTADVRGPHAIHIGYFGVGHLGDRHNDGGLYVRIAGEPHFTRFVAERTEPVYAEAYYKTVNCDGPITVEIASFGLRSALDYVKLTPVEATQAPPARGKAIGICDFMTTVTLNKPAGFEAAAQVRMHKDAGFDLVLWKAFKVKCEWHTKIGVRRDMGVAYDTFRQAVDEAKKVGLPLYAWMRFNNEDSKGGDFAPTTPFHLAHPAQRQAGKDGRLRPRTGFAFPEVRKHKVDLIREVASYGVDGVCIDVLRQPPAVEWDLPLVEAYIAQFGEDPRKLPGDGPERWLAFKSQAFTQFLREVRAALDAFPAPPGTPRMPLIVRTMDQPWRNQVCGCDPRTWLEENLVDGLIFAAHLPSASFYPQHMDLTPWLDMARPFRVPVYGQVWNCGSILEAKAIAADLYAQGVAGIAVYESEYAVTRSAARSDIWRLSRPEALPPAMRRWSSRSKS